jgi:putative oxidoreductase
MKIAVTIVRILLGLMFVFASVAYFLKLMPEPEMTGNVKIFTDGINASIYLMPLVKVFELVCSILFISGFFVPLATVLIFPIIVNILMFHAFLDPKNLPLAIVLMAANLFLAYYHRDKYKSMLKAK